MRLAIDEGHSRSRDLTEAELAGMGRFEVLVTEVDDDGLAVALTPEDVLAAERLLVDRAAALDPPPGAIVRVPAYVEEVDADGTVFMTLVQHHDRARAHLATVGRVAALLRQVDEEARVAVALMTYRDWGEDYALRDGGAEDAGTLRPLQEALRLSGAADIGELLKMARAAGYDTIPAYADHLRAQAGGRS